MTVIASEAEGRGLTNLALPKIFTLTFDNAAPVANTVAVGTAGKQIKVLAYCVTGKSGTNPGCTTFWKSGGDWLSGTISNFAVGAPTMVEHSRGVLLTNPGDNLVCLVGGSGALHVKYVEY